VITAQLSFLGDMLPTGNSVARVVLKSKKRPLT
jgi:hypothetical protein